MHRSHFDPVMISDSQHVRLYLVPSAGFCFVVLLSIGLVVVVVIVVMVVFVGNQIPNLVPFACVEVVE